jgi:hypothetical protein
VMKINARLARNIDFEVADFGVHEKTQRKSSILKVLQLIWGLWKWFLGSFPIIYI